MWFCDGPEWTALITAGLVPAKDEIVENECINIQKWTKVNRLRFAFVDSC